jgi:DNA replication protein DnaC
MREKDRKEQEEKEIALKLKRMNQLRSASLLGERYKDATFENTDLSTSEAFVKAFNRCQKYCAIIPEVLRNGYGIYLYGDSGTGKTHLTACICNELINKYQSCLFTNFFEISKLIRSSWRRNTDSEDIIKRICEVDFLFIDDLGTEKLQKDGEDNWLQEQVFDIINKRYNNRKPTIFSSNHSLNELITEKGMMQKTVDRINEMSTAIIKLTGASYRQKNKSKNVPF